jgi:hypothetical protein
VRIGAVIVAYFAVGVGAAAFRAYLDPFIFARSEQSSYRTRTLFYTEAILCHFAFWPIALTVTGLTIGLENWRRRGAKL